MFIALLAAIASMITGIAFFGLGYLRKQHGVNWRLFMAGVAAVLIGCGVFAGWGHDMAMGGLARSRDLDEGKIYQVVSQVNFTSSGEAIFIVHDGTKYFVFWNKHAIPEAKYVVRQGDAVKMCEPVPVLQLTAPENPNPSGTSRPAGHQ